MTAIGFGETPLATKLVAQAPLELQIISAVGGRTQSGDEIICIPVDKSICRRPSKILQWHTFQAKDQSVTILRFPRNSRNLSRWSQSSASWHMQGEQTTWTWDRHVQLWEEMVQTTRRSTSSYKAKGRCLCYYQHYFKNRLRPDNPHFTLRWDKRD